MMLCPRLCIVNRSRGVVIADQVEVAASFLLRAKGLIGRRTLVQGFALVIQPCNAVHTCFMAFPVDVAHVDRDGRIITILHDLKPWRFGPILRRSAWVIELPAGNLRAKQMLPGDVVDLVDRHIRMPLS